MQRLIKIGITIGAAVIFGLALLVGYRAERNSTAMHDH